MCVLPHTASVRAYVSVCVFYWNRHLCLTSFAIIIGGGAVFSGLAKGGHYLLRKLEEQEKVELAASGQHGESKVNYWTIEGTV